MTIKIIHGSLSPSKVAAVDRTLLQHFSTPFTLISIPVDSGVSEQPRSLAETVRGAKIRACEALIHGKGDLGIGLESGIAEFPGSRSGAMEITVCAVFNGKNYALGTSAGFEVPVPVMGDIIANTHTLTDGFESVGFIKSKAEREHGEGNILVKLTHGLMKRQDQNEQALLTALAQLNFPDLYGYNT
ncbi:MAG TPA: inosine/xanthosine triphosphatase [Candidatus Paceibacterota bacterium]|nr:inosine/xanthosine triphosphatase [Candidatus Paceibacterota bacterium]